MEPTTKLPYPPVPSHSRRQSFSCRHKLSQAMSRPKVRAHERRRVSRACDVCRRRKERCDGKLPCVHCASRSGGADCHYSPGVARRSGSIASGTNQSAAPSAVPRDSIASSGSLSDVEVILGYSPLSPTKTDAASSDSAPIPRQPRMLRDGRGKSCQLPRLMRTTLRREHH